MGIIKTSSTPRSSRSTRENRLRRGLQPRRKLTPKTRQGALFASLNHDVRTPMNGIIGMLNLLLDSGLTARQKALAQAASDSASQLFALLRDALELSLAETGLAPGRSIPFDLCRQLDLAVQAQALVGRARGVTVQAHYSGSGHAIVKGEPLTIEQVLGSVIDAAMAADRYRRIDVDIDLQETATGQCCLAVRVRGAEPRSGAADNAAGRQLLQHERGLRMALTLHLLAGLDGQANVESHPGQSDRFWFKVDFPLEASPLRALRVLFVEADADLRSDRLALLGAHGVRAEGFETANAALGALTHAAGSGDPFRIVMLDERMQGMDGEDTGRIIAGDPSYHASQLIMLSPEAAAQDGDPASAAQLAEAGFAAWLRRPFSTPALLSTLAQLATPVAPGARRPFLTNVNGVPQPGATAVLPFAGHRVLAVDDHDINLQVIQIMLQNLGCSVETATDGRQALALHRQQPFDLIFMDCLMPELDGYQASRAIRQAEGAARHTPIVALTAATLQEEQAACLAAGMDDVITKPVHAEHIRAALVRWLRPAPADALDSVRDLFGNDFIELATLFQSDSPKRLLGLQRAVAARDAQAVAKVAHTLAGSTISIGATGLSALCLELEALCKGGSLEGAAARLAAIEGEYDRIDERLRAMVRGMARQARDGDKN